MIKSSLIYVEHDGCYLMLHRVKKAQDPNKGKWIGVGGKFEQGETHEQCAAREMWEETGLTPSKLEYRGLVHFRSNVCDDEDMYLFTCTDYSGELKDCNEGELKWIPIGDVLSLNLWEGDRVFLELLQQNAPFFELSLYYEGDKLVRSELMNNED